MSSEVPKPFPYKAELGKASIEGNIRMPQNMLGVALYQGERVLTSSNPSEALDQLIAPIPLDDPDLIRRTERANVQHRFHNIEKVLTPMDVRDIQMVGNYQTLQLLGIAVNVLVTYVRRFNIDGAGNWANHAIMTGLHGNFLKDIQEMKKQFGNPEILAFAQEIFKSIQTFLETAEAKSVLHDRKELMTDMNSNDLVKQFAAEDAIKESTAIFVSQLQAHLAQAFPPEQLTASQEHCISAMSRVLERYIYY